MFGACTIIAANYIAYARVLAASFRRTHPDFPFWVLVTDDPEGLIINDEPFSVLHLDDIAIEDREAHQLAAIYDVLEMSTAVKPWLLQHLVAETGFPILYLDPDIEIYGDLSDLAASAEEHSLAVTPHLLDPLPLDGLQPDDAHIMGAGVYNLGFLGVGPSALQGGFFEFWQSRLWRRSIIGLELQMFTDQRWVDLIGCFDHAVIEDPSCNVAYWNVWSRPITQVNGQWRAAGLPLRFFHFSGFDADVPWILSKHQGDRPRVLLSDNPDLARLCRQYAETLLAAGHNVARHHPYGWAKSGTLELTSTFRRIYRTELMEAEENGLQLPPNPFEENEAFTDWLARPADPTCPVPRFLWAEHHRRPDLQAAFPDPGGSSNEALLNWARSDQDFQANTPKPLLARLADERLQLVEPLPGINVLGYLSAELGVGAVGRLVLQAARAVGVPVATYDNLVTLSRKEHPRYPSGDHDWRYDVNILCANADVTVSTARGLGKSAFNGRTTVGIWHWEAEQLPESVTSSWEHLDEVWSTSQFAMDAFMRTATKPVQLFPLPVPVSLRTTTMTRQDVGLPDGFVVLFSFDWLSVVDRKNPKGLIEAYSRAFRVDDGAHLVIKTINAGFRRAEFEQLVYSINRPDIHIVDQYVGWHETRAMMELCDCYASLHRSEGFGLTMAEAMALAKPVVATGWSGNLDFMNDQVSRLVPVEIVPIPAHTPVYGGIGRWADPDLDAAAAALRWVFDEPSEARVMGRRARDHLLATRSPQAAGQFLLEHAERLRREHGSVPLEAVG